MVWISFFIWTIVMMIAVQLLLMIFPGLKEWLQRISAAIGVIYIIAAILAILGYPMFLQILMEISGSISGTLAGEGASLFSVTADGLWAWGAGAALEFEAVAWAVLGVTSASLFLGYAMDPEGMAEALSVVPEFAGEIASTIGGTVGEVISGATGGLLDGLTSGSYGWLLIAAGGLFAWWYFSQDESTDSTLVQIDRNTELSASRAGNITFDGGTI